MAAIFVTFALTIGTVKREPSKLSGELTRYSTQARSVHNRFPSACLEGLGPGFEPGFPKYCTWESDPARLAYQTSNIYQMNRAV